MSEFYVTLVASLKDAVGENVFPTTLPGKTVLPAVVYLQVSGIAEYSIASNVPLARNPRYQFDCWGVSKVQAEATARLVQNAIQAMPYQCTVESEFDDYDPEAQRYRRMLDVTFLHMEGA